MIGRPRAPRPGPRLAAAVLVSLAACHHENPATPVPVLHALDVSASSLATDEGGPPASFDVVLRSRPTAPVEVEVRSADPAEGLVHAPGYAVPAPIQSVTFMPEDWDVPRQVAVDPVDDHVADGDVRYEVTARVTYTEDGAYAAVPAVSVAVTNADDDTPGIAVSAQALATREGGPAATFVARLTTAPSTAVYLTVASGDAAEGRLQLAGSGGCWSAQQAIWLYFDATSWNVSRTIEVCPSDEPFADGERVYRITLSPSPGYAPEYDLLPEVVVTVTNADDDVAALLVEAPVPLVTAENGAADAFTVQLATPPLADVVLPVTSDDPSQGLVRTVSSGPAASVSLVFTGANWSVPQTVTVVGQEDGAPPVVGQDVAYSITVGPFAGADPGYPSLPPRTLAALNLDDDVPRLVVDPAGPFTTSETGTGVSFVLSANPPPGAVVVRVTSGNPAEGLLVDPASGARQEQVDVTFSPSDWSPREIVVVAQQDEVADGDVSYVVTVAVVSGDAGYLALEPRGLRVTNLDDVGASVPRATYDPVLKAPRCASAGYGCGSGTLLSGRDGVVYYGTSLGETNAPNTLSTSASCPDGTYAYVDRSLDALKVYAPDASSLEEGKLVRIEASVRVYSWYYDRLDLFYAEDAYAPSWTYLTTLRPTRASGTDVLTTTYVLPAGPAAGVQAIRGTWRYSSSSPLECSTYSLDESDDLVFAVARSPGPPR